ncbi:MAG: SpaA isopeptide-forming pilin-related protein, partial [Lachnospiraceae bacterium]|nr:SpaA isopeptide-forming pilin-related protein [Lachnospiraceae bacterium]
TMPSSYKIPVGSRIVLSFDVTASQTASSEYLQNKTYNAKGDIETDADAYGEITSSLQAGFKSNTEATLTYNFGTTECDKETAEYAHPVIQVHPGNVLMLEKKLLDGDAESSVAKVEFKLYQISEDGSKWDAGKRPSEPYDTQFVVANADDTNTGKVTYTKLPVGCYELVETQTDPAYELLSQPIRIRVESQADRTLKYYVNDLNKENVEKEVSADKTDSNIHLYQSIANKRKQLTIQVVKRVKGNMSSPNDKFDFSYKTSENGKGIPLDKISAADTDGTTFTVPYGSYICVTESPDQYGYTKTEYQYQVGANEKVPGDGRICEIDKVTGNTTITFINTKQLTNPTGIFTNNTPYLWMLILAALGTLGIIYASYLRKRRRIHLKG